MKIFLIHWIIVIVFNCNIHHNVYCDAALNGSFTKEVTEYSSYLIGRAEMLWTFPFNKLAVSCDLLLKTRFLIFTIVTKTNIYQIKCNQRKTNERNNSARKIEPFCEVFQEERNGRSHVVSISIQYVSICRVCNFNIVSYNMIIWLKSLHHLLTVQLPYAQEVCCPLRIKCMWLTRCSYFGR